ncbi:type I polyketide synthase [Streptomyces alanosinicus]|uniref:Phthiocerol/phenolphthiocerol synthesis polyketide synthase type I PpsD n=1 Tax=Streptomyces alanosinicus TaxID=68171 RepID=A0A918YSU6_9ACTN|nr:type I polyketide synthase [Streptomyces alanosinicus]GHE14678.1 phthiocerol/phenolphthiocerol synthesis polyketide synthase type I PpsD [Streptomyces alanosinicus]
MPGCASGSVAVIGMGCRFPGGVSSPAGLWNLLVDVRDTVGPVPADRWNARRLKAFQHPDDAERYDRGCFIDGDIWAWEPEALSVAMLEAATVDPQHRLLLEVAWEAVEHAGVPVDRLRGSRTGVYLGMYAADNLLRDARPVEDYPDVVYAFGNFPANAAGRVAFAMDLRGPVMVVETMCSSGLVSVHVACTALAAGDCDAALAGAALLMPSPEWLHYEAEWLLSRKGQCFAFDGRADGYVRGEGAGVVLLKRLEDAVRDGDRVLAVIRGSAVNADGQSERMTAPSTLVQQDVFRAAVARSGVDPAGVGLVEAHGPGTYVGDPIEYTSINAVYGNGRGRCALGSVKTHIGHCEPASGLAGLIKAVECLQHGLIPPNRNFRTWHPSIPLDNGSRLFVPVNAVQEWPVPGERRTAAVCSYGISGTNAHMVLEQAPPTRPARRTAHARTPAEAAVDHDGTARVFLLSTNSAQALPVAAGRLADWLTGDGAAATLPDLAHTLALRRTPAGERVGVVASSRPALLERLRLLAAEEETEAVASGHVVLAQSPGPVLVFTGQGSQWEGMGRSLLETEPVFAQCVARIEPLMLREGGFSVTELLRGTVPLTGVDRIQPALFALQVALAQLWRSWGIEPAAVIGQSLGEVAAAVVAGALTLQDGVAVITRRAGLLAETAGGAMASVLLGADEVARDLAAASATEVSIAVLTSPEATVVSGDAAQVAALVADWQERGAVARMVDVDVASHSAQMDPILDRLHAALDGISPSTPRIRYYSTVTDDPRDQGPLDARYWVDNQRGTVRFSAACSAALADGHRLFVECSPHPVAVRAIGAVAASASIRDVCAVGSLRRDAPGQESFLTHLASVHCAGWPVDWASRYGAGELVDAPTASWHRAHYRKDPPYRLVAPGLVGADQHSLLGAHVHDPDQPGRHLWQTPIGTGRVPWLADHRVAGVPVMAGAGVCEMALAAAAAAFGTDTVAVEDLVLEAPLVLEPEPMVSVRLERDGDGGRVVVLSRTPDDPPEALVVHARATVLPLTAAPARRPETVCEAGSEWTDVAPADLYARFRERHDVTHGPAFAGLERIQLPPKRDEALVRLRIPNEGRVSSWMMRLHPALLDEVVQSAVAIWVNRYPTAPGPVVVAGFDAVRVYGPTGHARRAAVRLLEADAWSARASAVLMLADGEVVAEMEDLRLVNITPPEQRYTSRLSHLAWTPSAPLCPTAPAGRWLAVTEDDGPAARKVRAALADATAECRNLTVPLGEDLAPVLAELATAAWDGVVLVVGADASSPALSGGQHAGSVADPVGADREQGGPEPDTAAAGTEEERVARTIAAIQTLAGLPRPPKLRIAAAGGDAELSVAAVRGVVRTAAYEVPELAVSLTEFDEDADPAALAVTLLAGGPPGEYACRGKDLFTLRLRTGAPQEPGEQRTTLTPVRSGGAYLISGGLGGLGLLTAEWLAARGAGHLVLVTRSAPSPQARAVLSRLRAGGTSVAVVQGDIAALGIADRAVAQATGTGAALRGVFHCAGVLSDATLVTVDRARLRRTWRGKVDGARALHAATLGHELDHWVMYSSVASLLGSPGQCAHAAANAWLDGLAAWRLARGLPATSIQWGAWSEVGSGQHMADRGVMMISPQEGIDALERILTAGHGVIAYSPIDLPQWLASYPGAAASALFAEQLGDRTPGPDESAVLRELREAEHDAQRQLILEDHIIGHVREILGGTSTRITARTSLVALGVDSLSAVRLKQQLQNTLRIGIDGGILWLKPTAAGLAEWIMHRMGYRSGAAPDGEPDAALPTP